MRAVHIPQITSQRARTMAGIVWTAALVVFGAGIGVAQHGAKLGEWRAWAGDLRLDALRTVRPDQRGQLQQTRNRVALQDRQPRPPARLQPGGARRSMVNGVLYATAGTRRAVVALDAATGEHAVDPSARTKASAARARVTLRCRGAASATGPTARGMSASSMSLPGTAGRARRQDRAAAPRFGDNGVVDLKLEQRSATPRPEHRRHRLSTAPPSSATTSSSLAPRHRAGGAPRIMAQHQGLHSRLRRAHRQAPVDFSHHSDSRRVRQRHLAERFVVVHRATPACGRTSPWTKSWVSCTSPVEIADGRLLRRPPARQQPVRRQHRLPRPRHRRSACGTSRSCIIRHLGLRSAVRANSR